ncbi:ABC-three component system protein [Burkholderia cepacia]|uniref:ABC-three component system protein n=1 Tax=Burkholderia cepacia TaxID=292 RepID=UPI00398F1E0F
MTAGTSEQIKNHAVVVAEGSGVLVPAMTSHYAYVLTASHNVRVNREDPSVLRDARGIEVKMLDGAPLTVLEVFGSINEDAALLLIDEVNVEPVAYATNSIQFDDRAWLYGYPQNRRNRTGAELRPFRCTVSDISRSGFCIETSSFANYREVVGVSGGGVYKQVDQEWLLVGVEYSMEGPEDESQNWLKCVNISAFEDIIARNKYREVALAPLLPPFLLDFLNLLDQTFPLDALECQDTRQALRDTLQQLGRAKLTPGCPSPHSLMQKFGDRLLVHGSPRFRLTDKKLWLSWLELFIVSLLIDEVTEFDDAYIEGLRKRWRLLYSGSTQEWTRFMEDIAHSNLDGLDVDGLVIISNNRDGPPSKTRSKIRIDQLVTDISRPTSRQLDIDAPRKPTTVRTVVHLDGLHADCITRREEEYVPEGEFDRAAAIDQLTEAYREAIAQ